MNALLELIKDSPLWDKARAEGEVELVLRQLKRRVGCLSESHKRSIRRMGPARVRALGESLLKFRSRADLVKWLKHTAS